MIEESVRHAEKGVDIAAEVGNTLEEIVGELVALAGRSSVDSLYY